MNMTGGKSVFIWSFKTSKKELILLIIGVVLFIAAMIYVLVPKGDNQTSLLVQKGYSLEAETAEQRLAFAAQFGWELDTEPIEVREVVIPSNFSEVYESYNQIQLEQGFDLTEHKGERAKRWTYRVTNYPGTTDVVYINMLIRNGKVIGGDVCSTALNGFMHGFSAQDNAAEISEAVSAAYSSPVEQDRILVGAIPESTDILPENDGDE